VVVVLFWMTSILQDAALSRRERPTRRHESIEARALPG
jgi:hypothetical protein